MKERQDKIKLIAIDMDGTCVDHHKRVPKKNLWALQEACKAGILVVPATGRCVTGYPVAIRKLPGIRYVISSNGARVTDLYTNTQLKEVLIPCTQAAALLKDLRGAAVWTAIQQDGICIDNNLIPFIHRKLFYHGDFRKSRLIYRLDRHLAGKNRGRSTDQEANSRGVEKIQIFFLTPSAKKYALKLLKNYPGCSCALSHPLYVEITARGASKGEGLKTLCEQLGISPKQVMAIGDSDNDLSMLSYAGYPVAMGNARDAVKQAAVEVTAKNTQCGVAQAVMKAVRN